MKLILISLISLFLILNVRCDCINTESNGEFTITRETPRNSDYIFSSEIKEGQYRNFKGIEVGMVMIFEISKEGDTITITKDSYDGEVIAFGTTPLTLISSVSGEIFVHFNTPNCGSDSVAKDVSFSIINPCYFLANQLVFPSQLLRCLNSIPLDEANRKNSITQFRNMLRLHPFTDLLKSEEGLDVESELNHFQNKTYQNDFDFHRDMFLLSSRIPDSHTLYLPEYNTESPHGYGVFRKFPCIYLEPVGTSSKINLTGLAINCQGLLDVKLDLVKSINGVPITEYITKNFKNILSTKDDSLSFNFFVYNQIYTFQFFLDYFYNLNDQQELVYEDGTITSFPLRLSTPNDILSAKDIVSYASDSNVIPPPPPPPPPPSKKRNQVNTKQVNIKQQKVISNTKVSSPLNSFFEFESSNSKINSFQKKGLLSKSSESRALSDHISKGLFVNSENDLVPFLRITSFSPPDYEPYKKLVLDFVKDLSENQRHLAIIDVMGNVGGYTELMEWVVNVLSQTYPKIYEKNTFDSPSYNLAFNFRITDEAAKHYFYLSNFYYNDPTSGENFKNLTCLLKNVVTQKRSTTFQQFTPFLYLDKTIDYLEIPPFNTKFHIITNGDCDSSCSHFVSALRLRGLAKVFGIGGITGTNLETSYGYGTDLVKWNDDIVPFFPFTNFSILESVQLTFGLYEVFEFAPYQQHNQNNHNNHGNQNHHHNDHNNHHQNNNNYEDYEDSNKEYEFRSKRQTSGNNNNNQNNNNNSLFVPTQYGRLRKFVDEKIEWNQFSLDIFQSNINDLYSVISLKNSTVSRQQRKTFCTNASCYSRNVPCRNRF